MSQTQMFEDEALSPVARWGQFVNDPETDKVLRQLAQGNARLAGALTYFDGKIYAGSAVQDPGVIRDKNMLVDVDAYHRRRLLAAAGKAEDAGKIPDKRARGTGIFSDTMLAMMEQYAKVKDILDRYSIPYHNVDRSAIVAAAGPETPTAYETVRRVNYLAEVKGPKYNLSVYNAINCVTVKQETNLNVLGFRRTAKLEGQKEIDDNVVPQLATASYASYEKYLYADAFRYEFSQRELKDSQFDIRAQVTQDIPGIFAKLKDDKVIALAKAVTATTPTTNWTATTSGIYNDQADEDIQAEDKEVLDYGGADCILWPRAVANAYRRNINAAPGRLTKDSLSIPMPADPVRSWPLPLNEHITGFINEGIVAGEAVVIAKSVWATLLQGATIQVTYKNDMTPGQVEGAILFDFNGVVEQVAAAARRIDGLLA